MSHSCTKYIYIFLKGSEVLFKIEDTKLELLKREIMSNSIRGVRFQHGASIKGHLIQRPC